LLGFRETAPGFSLRPDNLRGGVAALRDQLMRLTSGRVSHEGDAKSASPNVAMRSSRETIGRVFLARDFDPPSDLDARSLWDADSLVRKARESIVLLRESAAHLHECSNDEAMVETFLVGGRVLQQLNRHPLLPPQILDPAPLAALLDEMKHYEELGRACWAPFLNRHHVPHRALPLDSRQSALGLDPTSY